MPNYHGSWASSEFAASGDGTQPTNVGLSPLIHVHAPALVTRGQRHACGKSAKTPLI